MSLRELLGLLFHDKVVEVSELAREVCIKLGFLAVRVIVDKSRVDNSQANKGQKGAVDRFVYGTVNKHSRITVEVA